MKKAKTKNKISLISKIVAVILIILTIFSLGFLMKIDILPIKYLILMIIILILFIGGISYVLLISKFNNKLKVGCSVFSTFIIIIIIFCLLYGFNTLGFLDKLKSKNYNIEKYYVVVLKNSKYNNLKDLNNSSLIIHNNSSDGVDSAIDDIKKNIEADITKSTDLNLIANDLLENKTDAIIIESSLKDILDEEIENFKTKTKIIYTIEVKTDVIETIKEVNITNQPFNIYISGIDTYGTINSVSRSDVNIIASVNPKTKQVLLTNIPRDYYVQLHNTSGYKDKLTHAGIYGIDMSINTIEDLIGIEINYYVKINFTSLIKIVDTIGGVDVHSNYDFTSIDGYKFKKGYNHMNGQQALSFSRERKSFIEGDRTRGENQQAVIAAIIKKISSPSIITKYNSILKSLEGSFATNISSQNIFKLIKMQLDDMASWNITSISLDGENASEYTHTYGNQKLYVMKPNQKTVYNAKKNIDRLFNGEILKGSYEDVSEINEVETSKKPVNNNNSVNNIDGNAKPNVEDKIDNNNSNSNSNPNSNSDIKEDNFGEDIGNGNDTTNENDLENIIDDIISDKEEFKEDVDSLTDITDNIF